MKRWRLIPWILAAVIVAGCVPTRYSWSPDGKWMTVITPDGLRLADAAGNLLPQTIPGVSVATWFPDSKRLLVSREIKVASWAEMTKYLTTQEIESITRAAEHTADDIMKYDWTAQGSNDWKNFENWAIARDQEAGLDTKALSGDLDVAVGLYVRDHANAALRQKLPAERWQELQEMTESVNCIEIHAVDSLDPTSSTLVTILRKGVHDLRVSPTGGAVLVTTESNDSNEKHGSSLWYFVLGPDGGNGVLSDRAAWYADWSPDGRDVVYIRSAQATVEDAGSLGSLSRQRVIGDDGKFIKNPNGPEDLAGVVYSELSRVRCLKDGRIIFASVDVTLPSAAKDMPQQPELFSLTPSETPMVSRLMPEQSSEQIGDVAQFFEVSPDGQNVSIPDKTGTVDVVDLRSGDVTAVQDKPVPVKDPNGDHTPTLLSIPQWRSDDELTFVAPGANSHPSVVLWSLSKNAGKALSTTWPVGITDADSSTTQPTTSLTPASK